jgi:hypothetical protein
MDMVRALHGPFNSSEILKYVYRRIGTRQKSIAVFSPPTPRLLPPSFSKEETTIFVLSIKIFYAYG